MTKIPFCEARGTLNSINDALSGDQASMWLDAFKRVLRRENPFVAIGRTLKILKVGVIKTHDGYLKAFKAAGAQVSDWVKKIFPKVPLAQTETEYELVEVSVAELGFTDWTRYDVICKRALEFGFGLCPAEVALALRLAYLDQPNGEWLAVAMEAIADPDGCLGVLGVYRGADGLWLRASGGRPGHEFHPEYRLVFVRRK